MTDSAVGPVDSVTWDGFLDEVKTVWTDPDSALQAVFDALHAGIDDWLSIRE